MSTTYNDFKPETRSLITALKKGGFQITGGSNGEDNFEAGCPDFLGELTACDEAGLYIFRGGFGFSVVLSLGKSPGELVSDYHYSRRAEGTQTLADLDTILDAHYSKWEGRKQPTVSR
jgi:hypothetical protein